MDRSTALSKIKKLFNVADCAAASEAEIATALRQASFLMKKFAVEEAEIAAIGGTVLKFEWTEEFVRTDPYGRAASVETWLSVLSVHVARFTDTRVTFTEHQEWGKILRFQGDAFDVMYSTYLMAHLRQAIMQLYAAYPGNRKSSNDYRNGIVMRIGERMKAYTIEATKAAQDGASSTALVLIDKKIVERDKKFGEPTYGKTGKQRLSAHTLKGYTDGAEVGFGRPVHQETKLLETQ